MKEIKTVSKQVKNCCGCRACEQICPVQCITMINEDGYLFPQVDETKCLKCGKCTTVCQRIIKNKTVTNEQTVYAAWSKNKENLNSSSSGGIFPVAAKYIIEHGGIVFGAIFDEDFSVCIKETDQMTEIADMQGSKYVFCDTKDTYKRTQMYLEQGKSVLYSGTPCQIAGLKLFLKKDYNELYCMELVCHGVPSSELLRKYMEYLQKKHKSKIVEFIFRKKIENQKRQYCSVKFENGNHLQQEYRKNMYVKTYNSLISHMDNCYVCEYKANHRMGDLTIGDFHGIEFLNSKHYNIQGTSLVIANTERGRKLIEQIRGELEIFPESMENAVEFNPALIRNIPAHPWKKIFRRI